MSARKLLFGTALLSALSAGAAFAQDQNQPRQVQEVIVTAQKREQSLQDVPIVVTSLSGDLLRQAGVHDIRELTILTPGLTVTSTSNETIVTARIRGIGTVGDNPGLESSVGVVIDGVYRPRNGVSFGDLGEVSRIEVLKGPQGTLFGKNTSAGVINIITAGPTREVHADSEVTVGDYDRIGFASSLSGPITDTLSGRAYLAGRYHDGYQRIVTLGGPRADTRDNDQNFYTTRDQLLWQPQSNLSVRLIGDYTKRDEHCCVGTQLFVGSSPESYGQIINSIKPGSLDLTSTPFDRTGYANRETTQRVTDEGVSGEINWDISDAARLTSITAWRDWRAVTGQDSDFTAADLIYVPNDGRNNVGFKQFSEEARLAGKAGPLDWLVGGFLAKEDLNMRFALLYGSDFYRYFALNVLGGVPVLLGLTPGRVYQPGEGQDDLFAQKDKSWALFTNNTYTIVEGLQLTAGLRYTHDEKTLNSLYRTTGGTCDQANPAFGTLARLVGVPTAVTLVGALCLDGENQAFDRLGPTHQSTSVDKLTGTAKLQYRFNPGLMTYVSYAHGFKAGGFNLDRVGEVTVTATGPVFGANPDTGFRPELADSYELGAKTTSLHGSLLLNAALFYQKYTDFQLNTFIGTAFIVETLPQVTSQGLDADFIYLPPVQGLSFQGGVTYANTEIGHFTASQLIDPSRFTSLRRLPGSRLSFAPLVSASLAGSYERDISADMTLRANVSAKYTSTYNTGSDLFPAKVQKPFTLVNARVGFGPKDEHWALELWSENLFNANYIQVGFNGPYQTSDNDASGAAISVYDAFLGAPRTYGATLRFKY